MRYIPHTYKEIQKMLHEIGVKNIDDLFNDIPKSISLKEPVKIGDSHSEIEVLKYFKEISGKNITSEEYISFCGGGVYDHFVPTVVDYLSSRSEFYTAYTPYQPEVSQGTLQVIYEYQSFICILTGMDISNASLYDGASAVAEALLMANRINGKSKVLISKTLHPEYIKTVDTYMKAVDVKVNKMDFNNFCLDVSKCSLMMDKDISAVVIQVPNFFGYVEDFEQISKIVHENKALLIVCVDPISLGMLVSPSSYNADIVVGDGQSLGNYPALGGSTFGFLATKKEWIRQLPGRIVGKTIDKENKTAFTLTLQTREQHIKRHRATSNICSNQSLNALRACIYCALMGEDGFKKIANLCFNGSHYLANRLNTLDKFAVIENNLFFKEFILKTPIEISLINEKLLQQNIIGGVDLEFFYPEFKNHMLLCVTEKRNKKEIDKFVNILKEIA